MILMIQLFFLMIFFFFTVDHFESLYWTYYNIAAVLCSVCFLAVSHAGSQLPDQGWNPNPLHWKAKS